MSRKRRGNGEGSLYQRADGTWCATISVGYDSQGKRKRRTIFGESKQDVQTKLAKLANDVAHQRDIEPQRIKLGEYLDRWLKDAAKPRVRETTHANYEGVVKNHIKPHLGGVPLAKLTAFQIHGLYSCLEQAGKSAETIRLVHAVLHRALKQAVRWRLIPFNMAADVDRPKVGQDRHLAADGRPSQRTAEGRPRKPPRGALRAGRDGRHAARRTPRPAVVGRGSEGAGGDGPALAPGAQWQTETRGTEDGAGPAPDRPAANGDRRS